MRNFEKDRLKFEPCADGVAVLYHGAQEKSKGGIIITGTMNDKFPATGTIIAASKEAEEAGYTIGVDIIYNNYIAEDVLTDGVKVDVLLIHNVIGKILL